MKVIVINAAPRMEAGNTHLVLRTFVDGMQSAGAEVDTAVLNRMRIERCIGCFSCYAQTPGICIHRDDVPALVQRIAACDLIVLATPLYIDGLTALAKTLIDRLVVLIDPHFVERDGRVLHPLRIALPKRIFLVSVCGYPGVKNFDPLLAYMERFAAEFDARFAGALLRPAVFSVLMRRKYPERVQQVMDALRTAGIELVRDGGVSQGTFAAAAADICSNAELIAVANAYWDRELEKTRSGSRTADRA